MSETGPPSARRKLLILDLDETLVHAQEKRRARVERAPDFTVFDYLVYRRPHLDGFLAYCLAHFDVAVWTSAGRDYAAQIVQMIFPQSAALQFVWSGERCTNAFDPELALPYNRKPLRKLTRRRTFLWRRADILVVDDSPEKWELSYGNAIYIPPFEGDQDDTALLHLMIYLEHIREHDDYRSLEKRGWRQQAERLRAEQEARKLGNGKS